MSIVDRTEFMYENLRTLDKLNQNYRRFNIETLQELLINLIDWMEGEIFSLATYKISRDLELTLEIDFWHFYNKFEYIRDIANNSEITNLISILERRNNKYLEIRNNLDSGGDIRGGIIEEE